MGPVAGEASSDAFQSIVALISGLTVHDVSPTIGPDLPGWFMYEPARITPLFGHAERGAAANSITLAEHTGTHIDAPFHFDAEGKTIDQVAPDALFLRPYKKFDLATLDLQPGDLVSADTLNAAAAAAGFVLEAGDVAVIDCGWDRYLPGGSRARQPDWWGRNQPGLAQDACAMLLESGVVAVASDTAACDVAARDGEIIAGHGHASAFLPNGVLIVEGLRGLADVPDRGLFVALPLKIQGGTGSPVRVLLLSA
jgi:kynurenine formamidase